MFFALQQTLVKSGVDFRFKKPHTLTLHNLVSIYRVSVTNQTLYMLASLRIESSQITESIGSTNLHDEARLKISQQERHIEELRLKEREKKEE